MDALERAEQRVREFRGGEAIGQRRFDVEVAGGAQGQISRYAIPTPQGIPGAGILGHEIPLADQIQIGITADIQPRGQQYARAGVVDRCLGDLHERLGVLLILCNRGLIDADDAVVYPRGLQHRTGAADNLGIDISDFSLTGLIVPARTQMNAAAFAPGTAGYIDGGGGGR